MKKKILIFGGGGFIGGHLAKRLSTQGHTVVCIDIKPFIHWSQFIDNCQNYSLDLRNADILNKLIQSHQPDEIYQLAADMGGAGYIFTGEHDADVMHNSASINLNTVNAVNLYCKKCKIFYSSSACIYPAYNQENSHNPNCKEESVYPADPDSEYGWEKLFSERLYLAFAKNHGLQVRIARFHNIFGPQGTWKGGKEKAPAAICRKVAEAQDGTFIEIWGDGLQTRSFLYIDECVDGVLRLMESDFMGPVNIGSDEMVTINQLAEMAILISGKKLSIQHIPGPQGVRGRNSDNTLIYKKLGWKPTQPLLEGIKKTFNWINDQAKSCI